MPHGNARLLSDAKGAENFPEHVFAVDPAHDLAHRPERGTQLLRDELRREPAGERLARGRGKAGGTFETILMPRIDRHGPIAVRGATAGHAGDDPFNEQVDAVAAQAGEPHAFHSVPGSVFAKVDLIEDEDRGRSAMGHRPLVIGHFSTPIHDVQHEVRKFDLPSGARDAGQFDRVVTLAHAGGVDEAQRDAAEVDDFLDHVPRGAGLRAHDRAFVPEEQIEERGFADVRRPVDHGADAFAEDLAAGGGGEQGVDLGAGGIEPGEEGIAGVGVDVFIREIDERFDVGEEAEEVFTKGADAVAEPAFELLAGGAQREVGLRGDEIHHGFSLGEVELSVKVGALGEFTGLGGASAVAEEQFEDSAGDEHAAMAGDFDHVFPGVTRGRTEDGEQHVVDLFVAIEDRAVLLNARRQLCDAHLAPESRIRQVHRARAAEPEQGDGAFTEGRGDGGDGVVHGRTVASGGPAKSPLAPVREKRAFSTGAAWCYVSPMSRPQGFTLLEIMLAIVIGLLLMGVAVPSVIGLMREQRLKETYEQFDDFARAAQTEAVKKGKTMVMIWDEASISLVPLDPEARDEGAEPRSFPFPDGATMTLSRPAALVKKPVPEWPFWRTGACEPAIVNLEGPGGTWTAEYNGLTARGRITDMHAK